MPDPENTKSDNFFRSKGISSEKFQPNWFKNALKGFSEVWINPENPIWKLFCLTPSPNLYGAKSVKPFQRRYASHKHPITL